MLRPKKKWGSIKNEEYNKICKTLKLVAKDIKYLIGCHAFIRFCVNLNLLKYEIWNMKHETL